MKRKKNVIFILAGALLVLFLGLWLFRVIRLNSDFHQTKREADMGEEIEYDGITYEVTDAVIYDFAAAVQEWEDYSWLGTVGQLYLCDLYDGHNKKILVYTVHMRLGDGEEGEKIRIPNDIQTQSGSFTNVYEMWMYSYLNPDLVFYPNTEIDVWVPVMLPQGSFTEEEWNQLSEEDPKLEAIIAFQPEIVKLHLNRVRHVSADEQAVKELDSLIETAVTLRAAGEEAASVIQETNLYEKNEGDCNGIHYSLGEVSRTTLEEVQALTDRAKGDFYANRTDDLIPYWFQTSVTMTNTTDRPLQVYLTNTRICLVENETVKFPTELFYQDLTEFSDGHNAGLYILEPGESLSVDCIYDVLYYLNYEEEMESMDYYLAINPNGIDFHSLRDTAVVFIKYENGLQTE